MSKHRILRRAVLVLVGLLIGVVLLEIALQIGAWYIDATGREVPRSWATGDYRILCLGDSNTYGLYLDKEDAYPQQLETLWNQSAHLPKSEVLNLGFPGTNSSRLLRDFPRMLEVFLPDLVIIMVGVNDFWTMPVPVEPQRDLRYRTRLFLQRHSRAYRLFYLIRRGLDTAELEVVRTTPEPKHPGKSKAPPSGRGFARYGDQEFALGWKKAKPGTLGRKTFEKLEENLCALSNQARNFGAKLILMTYPSRYKVYFHANKVIRKAAAKSGTPLIDLTAVFKPVCPQEACPELLFHDHHPKAPGYRLIAETIVRAQ